MSSVTPAYFFTSGLAGASPVLSTSARLAGNEKLARTALYVGAAANLVAPALLVSDLGRPEQAVKVSSPMNAGSWALLVSGGASTTAAVLELLGRLKVVKVLAEAASTLSGPLLATSTGALLADTTVPAWREARRELPWIFGASAAASAGAAACLFLRPADAGPARRLSVAGVLAEGALMQAMELRLGEIGEAYRQGQAGRLSWAAKGLATAGAALLARRAKKSRASAVLGGALVCAGEICLRWTVLDAGTKAITKPG